MFLFAVSFANLPFHPVSFYSPFETSFRHGHQYGYKRSRGFYGMKTTRSGKADMDLLPPANRASMMRLLHKRSDL